MPSQHKTTSELQDTNVLDDDDLLIVAGAAQSPAELVVAMPESLRAALEPFGPRRYVPWIPPASD